MRWPRLCLSGLCLGASSSGIVNAVGVALALVWLACARASERAMPFVRRPPPDTPFYSPRRRDARTAQ